MAFIFTCGTHIFQSPLPGYENVMCQCQNCGNFSAKCYKRWQWFTLCFIPLIPFSLKPWHEVGCHICNFYQDLKYRPDVQHGQQSIAMQGQGQGNNGPGPGSGSGPSPGYHGPPSGGPGPNPGSPPPPAGYYGK